MVVAYQNKEKLEASEFYRKRFARTYPVYLFSLLLLIAGFLLFERNIDLIALCLNIFVVQAWFPPYATSFNYPGWSIAVEYFFYALFPIVFNNYSLKLRLKKLALIIILFWILSQALFHLLLRIKELDSFSAHFPLMHLNQFLIGNLFGLIYLKSVLKLRNYDIPITLLFLTLILILVFPGPLNYQNGLLAVIFAPLILLISLNTGKITLCFNQKILVFLGKISYSLYILQFPVFFLSYGILNKLLPAELNIGLVKFYFSTSLLLCISCLTYRYIETPIRIKLKKVRKSELAKVYL